MEVSEEATSNASVVQIIVCLALNLQSIYMQALIWSTAR